MIPSAPFLSLRRGDGGLTPGQLVFNEEFVAFAGSPFETVLNQITGGKAPDKRNIGGPSIVSLIHAAQLNGCITIVNTVFDFRNEKLNPNRKWPLGKNEDSYQYIDLLIADQEEAFRLSGESTIEAAVRFFMDKQVSALIITNGSNPVSVYSNGQFFDPLALTHLPVSQKVIEELKYNKDGDTTGCGDNFVGGVITSIVNQLQNGVHNPNLQEACYWGIVSGGFACFYMGGTWFEQEAGEKLAKIKPYYEAYVKQIRG